MVLATVLMAPVLAQNAPQEVNRRPDVYLVGSEVTGEESEDWEGPYTNRVAMLWKNGEPMPLADGKKWTTAEAVHVSGGDVYVAGTTEEHATVWKNGVARELEHGFQVDPNSIFVQGGDVYVAGTGYSRSGCIVEDYLMGQVWRNGKTWRLGSEKQRTSAKCVTASNGRMHIAGTREGNPVLWADGRPKRMGNASLWGTTRCLFASGDDIYVLGTTSTSSTEEAVTVWKNGTARYLTDGKRKAAARSVWVSGADIYVAGNEENADGVGTATLWRNGEARTLDGGGRYSSAEDVCVAGGDVYVLVRHSVKTDAGSQTMFSVLKNGAALHTVEDKNGTIVRGLFVE